MRLANIPTAYAGYLIQSVWPVDLAFFYPHPTQLDGALIAKAVGSLILLAGVSTFVLLPRVRASRPHLAVGWLWYLGTLVPVIGILQVGEQAMADRYTYLPMIGIAIALSWELGRLVRSGRAPASVVTAVCVISLAALAVGTHRQVGRWRDNITLYSHALEVTSDNYLAHALLGAEYLGREEYDAATEHLLEALRIEPRLPQVHYNIGLVHIQRNEWAEAEARFRIMLKYKPNSSEAHNNLGILLEQQGRLDQAIAHYRKAVESMPENLDAQSNLRDASRKQQRGRFVTPR
jgi:tetratricopeptide (TPR) repeat protein